MQTNSFRLSFTKIKNIYIQGSSLWSVQNSRTYPGIFKVYRAFPMSWYREKLKYITLSNTETTTFLRILMFGLTTGKLQKTFLHYLSNRIS